MSVLLITRLLIFSLFVSATYTEITVSGSTTRQFGGQARPGSPGFTGGAACGYKRKRGEGLWGGVSINVDALTTLSLATPNRCFPFIAISVSLCLYVCLSVRWVVWKTTVGTSRNVMYMLRVATSWSFCDNNAIRYVLPVLWMTSCFHIWRVA